MTKGLLRASAKFALLSVGISWLLLLPVALLWALLAAVVWTSSFFTASGEPVFWAWVYDVPQWAISQPRWIWVLLGGGLLLYPFLAVVLAYRRRKRWNGPDEGSVFELAFSKGSELGGLSVILALDGGALYGGYRLLAWLPAPIGVEVFLAVVGLAFLGAVTVNLLDEFGIGHGSPERWSDPDYTPYDEDPW